MKTVVCEACGKTVPVNDSYTVHERTFCIECAQAWANERAAAGHQVDASDFVRGVDPTICAWCETDSPHEHAARIADVPTCEECDARMRNYPFPLWVKASFLLLLVAGVVSFAINARFLLAYLEHRKATRHLHAGEFAEAADIMQQASRRVPEVRDYDLLAGYTRGMALLAANNARAAVPVFQRLAEMEPRIPELQFLLLCAEAGVAFDDKDYRTFLQKAQALDANSPGDAFSKLQLASAYACLYVANNDQQARAQARQALDEAKQLPSLDPVATDVYRNRILHRITTREIINSEEYERRFPNGWQPPVEPQQPLRTDGARQQWRTRR